MTAGALLQIRNGNTPRMAFLVNNPQISHFKSIYKRYTNFSKEYITLLPNSSGNVDDDQDVELNFQIPRNADLINDIYFSFELPDIYSRNGLDFQWIRRLGEYMVKDVSLQIGSNTLLDKQYSEWFHIYNELNLTKDQKEGYNRMIGNVVDMYDPEGVSGHSDYPGTNDSTSLTYPSIVGRRLLLPLQFWFNKHSSKSFPLVALQYDIMAIKLTLRPLKELYTIYNTSTNYRERPSTAAHKIGKFLKTSNNETTLNINPRLEANYIYLDNDERKSFALASHSYLATQVQRIVVEGTTTDFDINLANINKPITQLYFIIRRTDFENVNLWSNFINWYDTDKPIYASNHIATYRANPTITTSNIKHYQTRQLVKSAELLIDNNPITTGNTKDFTGVNEQIEGKDYAFYNLLQNYRGSKSIPDEGIYTYSFNLDDHNNIQPNGCCNFSNLNNKRLRLFLNEVNTGDGFSYSYNIHVYAVNYEIIKLMGGLVNTTFSN